MGKKPNTEEAVVAFILSVLFFAGAYGVWSIGHEMYWGVWVFIALGFIFFIRGRVELIPYMPIKAEEIDNDDSDD